MFGILDLEVEDVVKLDNLFVEESIGKVSNGMVDSQVLASNKDWEAMHHKESIFRQKSRHKWIKEC